MTYQMFLDDERTPKYQEYTVVRSFDQFWNTVSEKGFPNFISFDHDLGEGQKTGMDVVKHMIDYDMNFDVIPEDFDFHVHSANPPGKANIEGLLTSYLKFKRMYNE